MGKAHPTGPHTTDVAVETIEVFGTGATIAHEPDVPSEEVPLTDVAHHVGAALVAGLEHARDLQATPGHRPGAATSSLSGWQRRGENDIVRPVLVNPLLASRLATSGELFDEPLTGLRIDSEGRSADDRKYLIWHAGVRIGRNGERRATLHLLASPSMVVTILELVPAGAIRWRSGQFIRDGVQAMEGLAHRLERASTAART